jgi:uncharacterized protein
VSRLHLRFTLAGLVSLGIGVNIGCTSVPVHYYTLAAPPEKARTASEIPFAIDVRVNHIPPQLNRSELMIRTGATELALMENERWASPVNVEIKEALRLELQRRLDLTSGFHARFTTLTLDIDVQRLEAEFGRYAMLEVSWSADLSATGQQSNGTAPTFCTFRADEKIQAGYAELVEGYQREIAALADAIVAVLTSPASGIDVSCRKSIAG